jgi:methylmalonyl-CoA mutase
VSVRHSTNQTPVVPPARTRYLAEIADTVRGYKASVREAGDAGARDPAAAGSRAHAARSTSRRARRPPKPRWTSPASASAHGQDALQLLQQWPDMKKAYAGDEYVVKIRDQEIRTALTYKSLSAPPCARCRCRSTRTTASCSSG